jgi:hypothetical protein
MSVSFSKTVRTEGSRYVGFRLAVFAVTSERPNRALHYLCFAVSASVMHGMRRGASVKKTPLLLDKCVFSTVAERARDIAHPRLRLAEVGRKPLFPGLSAPVETESHRFSWLSAISLNWSRPVSRP